ncbi:hypothetical protein B481_3433 [Planococcus halocryophilus Or1]|nr:hypothetical protein B481_3433 [Planococcus halocryophilus Or1]
MEYSLLISITGIGSVSGALFLTFISNKISIRSMIVIGMLMMSGGYVIYAFSWSFVSIAVGFIILGFFNVFLNAGIATFYQNNIPVSVMGRVTSVFQLFQSVFQIFFILAMGFLADIISLKLTIASLSIIMSTTAIIYSFAVWHPKYSRWYEEDTEDLKKARMI